MNSQEMNLSADALACVAGRGPGARAVIRSDSGSHRRSGAAASRASFSWSLQRGDEHAPATTPRSQIQAWPKSTTTAS
jgi:hypothetical protein